MNKQLWLSPSAISDFKNCPRLYYYRSVYRIVTPQLTLGGVIHDTLARFMFLEKVADRKAALEEIFEKLWAQKSGLKGGFNSQEGEAKFKGRGRAMFEKFLKTGASLFWISKLGPGKSPPIRFNYPSTPISSGD